MVKHRRTPTTFPLRDPRAYPFINLDSEKSSAATLAGCAFLCTRSICPSELEPCLFDSPLACAFFPHFFVKIRKRPSSTTS